MGRRKGVGGEEVWVSSALSIASPQLSMLRISPSLGHPLEPKLALQHLLFLLEYCMVTGYDWWDILLHVQPGMVQSLVERLHEEYTRQKPALQQVGLTGGRVVSPE